MSIFKVSCLLALVLCQVILPAVVGQSLYHRLRYGAQAVRPIRDSVYVNDDKYPAARYQKYAYGDPYDNRFKFFEVYAKKGSPDPYVPPGGYRYGAGYVRRHRRSEAVTVWTPTA